VWAIGLTAVRMLSAFLAVPLVIGALGEERFGLWRLVAVFAVLASILDAGFTPYAKNRMTEARAADDRDGYLRYGRAALEIGGLVALAGVILAGLFLLPDWRPLLGARDVLSRSEAATLMASVTLVMMLMMALSGVDAAYDAAGRLSPPRIAGIVGVGLCFAGLVVAVRAGGGLLLVTILTAMPTLAGRLLLLGQLMREQSELLKRPPSSLRTERAEILRRSSPFAMVQAGNVGFAMIPAFFITQTVGLASVAVFNLANQLATLPMAVVAAVLPVFWPSFTLAYAQGHHAPLFRRIRRVAWVSALGCVAFMGLLMLVGPWFSHIWTRGKITLPAPLFAAFGAYVAVQVFAHWYATFLQSVSDFWYQTACLAATLVILSAGLAVTRALASPQTTALVMAFAVLLGQAIPYALRVNHWKAIGQRS